MRSFSCCLGLSLWPYRYSNNVFHLSLLEVANICDLPDRRKTAELPPGETTPVLQPLPRPPRRHLQRLAVPASAQPPTLLVAHLEGAAGLMASLRGDQGADSGGSVPDVYISLSLQGEDLGSVTEVADSWGVRGLRYCSLVPDNLCQYPVT